MGRSTLDMNYNELKNLLDSLLKKEGLVGNIEYKSDKINYSRRSTTYIIIRSLFKVFEAELYYNTYIRKRLKKIKKNREAYNLLKKTGCIKALRTYLHLSKIGFTDLINHLGGRFDIKLFANFTIATMLYDAAFDVKFFSKYLRYFDAFVMKNEKILEIDEYMVLFKESVEYLRNKLDEQKFETFMNYVKIENVSQFMSIYQLSDKKVSAKELLKITFSKGGISALALTHIMVPKLNKKEKKAIFELGAAMQLMDDIGDIEEDIKSGIQTLPNLKLLNFDDLKQFFQGTVNNLIKKCNIDSSHPNSSLDILTWFADTFMKKRYKRLLDSWKQNIVIL